MPNIKSAMKRMRTSERDRRRNQATKSAVQSWRNRVLKAITEDVTAAEPVFHSYCSILDKAVKRGIVARNTANRGKQRMARRLNKARQTA